MLIGNQQGKLELLIIFDINTYMKRTKTELLNELILYYETHGEVPVSRTFHIHQNNYRYHFGNWNNALMLAGIPTLNETSKVINKCLHCSKNIVTTKSRARKFCNQSCSASFNNKIRTLPAKPKSLKKYSRKKSSYQMWLLSISGTYCPVYNRTCKHCGNKFISPKHYSYCNQHISLYNTPNRDRYRFNFNVFKYPDLFDLDQITKVGFYDGQKGSQHKITRDHKISVTVAIKSNYSPYYITHPMNCELMTWSDNHKKRADCSITYNELIHLVDEYELIKFKTGIEPAASTLPK